MSDQKLDSVVKSVSSHFAVDLIHALNWDLVLMEEFSTLFEGTDLWRPVYLPVFQTSSSDIYALHVMPNTPWENWPWMFLSHDFGLPRKIASSARHLPACLYVDRRKSLDAGKLQELLAELAGKIPSGQVPDFEALDSVSLNSEQRRLLMDPGDLGNQVPLYINSLPSLEEARSQIELLSRTQGDAWTCFLRAAKAIEANDSDVISQVLHALSTEILWNFSVPNRWIANGLSSMSVFLTWFMETIWSASPEVQQFGVLSGSRPGSDRVTIAAMMNYSRYLHREGESGTALGVARNAIAIAQYETGFTPAFCEYVAELSAVVEPNGIASDVALKWAECLRESGG